MTEELSRRALIGALSASLAGGLAGCAGTNDLSRVRTSAGSSNETESTPTEDSLAGSVGDTLGDDVPWFSKDEITVGGAVAVAAVPSMLSSYEETRDIPQDDIPEPFAETLSIPAVELAVTGFGDAFSYLVVPDARSAATEIVGDEPVGSYRDFDRYDVDGAVVGVADSELIYARESEFLSPSAVEVFRRIADAAAGETPTGPVDENAAATIDAIEAQHYLLTFTLFGDRTLEQHEDFMLKGAEAVSYGVSLLENGTARVEYAVEYPEKPDPAAFAEHVWSFGPLEMDDPEVSVDGTTAVARQTTPVTERTAPTTTATPSADHVVDVVGEQWSWTFSLPDHGIAQTGSFTLPAGRAIEFQVTSTDVIHSLHIPVAGVKIDAVPGQRTTGIATFEEPGSVLAYCAEFCGSGHSDMLAQLEIVPPAEFDSWVADQS